MAENDQPKQRNCGTMPVHERLLRTVPGYREARDRERKPGPSRRDVPAARDERGCTNIPVVVHVVHKTAARTSPMRRSRARSTS